MAEKREEEEMGALYGYSHAYCKHPWRFLLRTLSWDERTPSRSECERSDSLGVVANLPYSIPSHPIPFPGERGATSNNKILTNRSGELT